MRLATLFQDGAVLQRRASIPVWGWTEGNCIIKAELAGKVAYSHSADDGNFILRFGPMEAGGPYSLTVLNMGTGDSVEIKDVMIGEVWLASGQSNMEYQLCSDWATYDGPSEDQVNYQQNKEYFEKVDANKVIRFISVPRKYQMRRENIFDGRWVDMREEPHVAAQVSAAAGWFGYFISQKLDIPVGLIVSADGGSIAEAWTSRAGLMHNPEMRPLLEEVDSVYENPAYWNGNGKDEDKALEPKLTPDPGNTGIGKGWANLDFDDSDWADFKVPGSWKMQHIAGNGVLWARLRVTIPEDWAGKELILRLGGVDKIDITYFNGVEIGRTGKGFDTMYWNVPRGYTVPAELVKAGEAQIAVRIFSCCFDGSMSGSSIMYSLLVKEDKSKSMSVAGIWKAKAEVDFGDIVASKVSGVLFGPGYHNTPSMLFDSMIQPLIPYAMRGVIWYQGESDANDVADADLYAVKLKAMIEDWRYYWGQAHFPFIQVQLANYHDAFDYDEKGAWAILREKQLDVSRTVPEVYMVSAVDIGETNDVHPQNKKEVGWRLAENALCNVYGQDVESEGPRYEGCSCEGNAVRVSFSHAKGLTVKGVEGFMVAGFDREFVPAECVIVDGTDLLVSSSKVKRPRAVRYAWADNPPSMIFNAAGYPASPFRTDSWQIIRVVK